LIVLYFPCLTKLERIFLSLLGFYWNFERDLVKLSANKGCLL
jgi:hypothetical protein